VTAIKVILKISARVHLIRRRNKYRMPFLNHLCRISSYVTGLPSVSVSTSLALHVCSSLLF